MRGAGRQPRVRYAGFALSIVAMAIALLCAVAGETGVVDAGQSQNPVVNAGADASANAGAGADADASADASANAGAGADAGAGANADAGASANANANAGASGGDDADGGAGSGGDAPGGNGPDGGAREGALAGAGASGGGAGSGAVARAEAYDRAFGDKSIRASADDARLRPVGETEPRSTRYTLMVYMVGSNLESQNAAATDDLQEMLASKVDFSQVNLVVYAGGTKRWNSDIPAGRNSVLDLSRPKGDRIVAQTDSDVSMGAPQTLAEFVSFCAERYPADHTALVFWDHGGGPLWGFGNDELAGGDSLLLAELRDAMEQTPFAKGSKCKLDWVGFDACLMGCMENALLWSDYARYLVASEEVEPGAGWDYAFLSIVSETDDPRAIGRSILGSYQAYYESHANTISNPDLTLALFDLSKASAAVKALNGLFAVLENDIESGSYAQVNRSRREAKAFGLSAVTDRAAGYDLVDVGDLASIVSEQHPERAGAVSAELGKLVVERYTNVENASGVSLYLPGDNRELFNSFTSAVGETAEGASPDAQPAGEGSSPSSAAVEVPRLGTISGAYDSFVNAYVSEWFSASQVDWSLAEVQSTEEGLTLQLTDEQVAALSNASYTVMAQTDDSSAYLVLTSDVSIRPDDRNVLSVPADPQIIALKSQDDVLPGFFIQLADENGKQRYVDPLLYAMAAGDFDELQATRDPRVTATVSLSEDGSVHTESLFEANDSIGAGGKGSFDISKCSRLVQWSYCGGRAVPKFDSDGRVLPWREWESAGLPQLYSVTVEDSVALEDSLQFVATQTSEQRDMGRFFGQIVITDVNGDQHALAPEPLATPERPQETREITQATKLGAMTFEVSDDHATLTKYKGGDWTLDIPTEVEGVPVTTIGDLAFESRYYLDELVIPEGITTIGNAAFRYSGLYRLALPSTLAQVGKTSFVGMKRLREFSLAGKSQAVSVRDGVLFSADGKRLVAYPAAKGDSYAVPRGTEAIGYGAFAESGIKQVEFPDGLRAIEPAAFFDCEKLASLDFPNSLESIGSQAFGRSLLMLSEKDLARVFSETQLEWQNQNMRSSGSELARIDRVELGPNVREIGAFAFSGIALSAIDVDERNQSYSSKGGVLLNATGDTLVEAPLGITGIVEVPEGIVALSDDAFADYPKGSEFILPDSLARCSASSFPGSYETDERTGERLYVNDCVIHAKKGTYAARFAAEHGIAFDNETDKDKLAYRMTTVQIDGYTLLFRVYADRAVLTAVDDGSSYNENAKAHVLSVPPEVEGRPVTEIAPEKDVIRLRTGSSSDDDAASVEELVLPASVSSVEAGSLSFFKNLERIGIDGESAHFSAIDGVLFSADGTVLVAYPCNRGAKAREDDQLGRDGSKVVGASDFTPGFSNKQGSSAYEVPDGVEVIGERAFYYVPSVSAVALPDSVERIGRRAFYGCDNLGHVGFGSGLEAIGDAAFSWCSALVLDGPLPESLESIGKDAFNRCASFEGVSLPDSLEVVGGNAFDGGLSNASDELRAMKPDVLVLGSHLKRIGLGEDSPFKGLDLRGFDVSADNESYRSEGPFIVTKDGVRLVAFASGFEGEARIPDGVREIDAADFDSARRLTDLYIPASVRHISGDDFQTGGAAGVLSSVRVHVPRGSYAERYAREKGLAWEVE